MLLAVAAQQNIKPCFQEVLLILDNYHHEFQALIDWINLQERLENTDIHDRYQLNKLLYLQLSEVFLTF